MTSATRLGRAAAALAGIAVFAAACTSSGGATPTVPAQASTSVPTAGTSAGAPSAATGTTALNVKNDATLGSFVVDQDGKSLYLFTPDTTSTPTCNGACATSWPPFVVTGAAPTAGSGVTGTIATSARQDGSMQVTLNGHPLYYFAGDSAAGDIKGQGLNGKWYVLSPSGDAVQASPAAVGY
jgi:predicted lipoprotein with Yx(FWY)xxD motif